MNKPKQQQQNSIMKNTLSNERVKLGDKDEIDQDFEDFDEISEQKQDNPVDSDSTSKESTFGFEHKDCSIESVDAKLNIIDHALDTTGVTEYFSQLHIVPQNEQDALKDLWRPQLSTGKAYLLVH